MEKEKAEKGPDQETLLKQHEFIRNSKISDIPALCLLEQSKNTSVRHAACKRRHALEKYAAVLKNNPKANISKGKSNPSPCCRARIGEASSPQRF